MTDEERTTYWVHTNRWYPTDFPMTIAEVMSGCEELYEAGRGSVVVHLALLEGDGLIGVFDHAGWHVEERPCPKSNLRKNVN